jgi:hypothetical protein
VRIHGRNFGCLSQDDAVAASNSGLAEANHDMVALIACGLEQMFSRVSMDDNEADSGETQLQRIMPYTEIAGYNFDGSADKNFAMMLKLAFEVAAKAYPLLTLRLYTPPPPTPYPRSRLLRAHSRPPLR